MKKKIIKTIQYFSVLVFIISIVLSVGTMCSMMALFNAEERRMCVTALRFIDITFAISIFFAMISLLMIGIDLFLNKNGNE